VPKIDKSRLSARDLAYGTRVASARRSEIDALTTEVARSGERLIAKYRNPAKLRRYAKDLEILENVPNDLRGEVDYRILGNRQLRIDKPGELTRERGLFSKTRKIIRSDESGVPIVSKIERNNSRKLRSLEFNEAGELTARRGARKNGSFKETWTRDSNGDLVRASYYTNRLRDGRLFRSISEELGEPDKNGNRQLVRRKGRNEKVFERSPDGNLVLIGRQSRYSSTLRSNDKKSATTRVWSLGGMVSKTYRARLDRRGNAISKDLLSRRRFLDKVTASYDRHGALREVKHTVGKLYRTTTNCVDGDSKLVSRRVLGIKMRTRLERLSPDEKAAFLLRAEEASTHEQEWKSGGVTADPVPEPQRTVPLGSNSAPDRQQSFGSGTTLVEDTGKTAQTPVAAVAALKPATSALGGVLEALAKRASQPSSTLQRAGGKEQSGLKAAIARHRTTDEKAAPQAAEPASQTANPAPQHALKEAMQRRQSQAAKTAGLDERARDLVRTG
jgi:hypothetical protein